MDFESIRKLIDTLIEKHIDEFELEEEGRRIRIRRGGPPAAAPAPAPATMAAAAGAPAPLAAPPTPTGEEDLLTVSSPIVGTYYESPSPGSPEFVKIGDTVEVGQVLCIIEAMKLMNEIEAETQGEVVRKLVTNGQPVEFGQPLLLLRPRK
ncbi:MAG TPA: acetyl-CoA carboxylase biotin carboxyl carrier protein [Terriglobales bacterium]|jgi:acetyl-CoA carboxylase biotin carboxyl carrier protein